VTTTTTTSTSLVTRRVYLDGQRRGIIARAFMGSLAGGLPIPFLDDWAVEKILGNGYRRIAASHHIDLDPLAVTQLVHGTEAPAKIANTAFSSIAYRIAGTAAKRMLLAFATVKRARAAARTFVTMTLFDHYCAKLHTGGALDGPTALALRDEITRTIEHTPGALAFHPFRRAALSAARATLRAPLELADMASSGGLRRLLARRSEVHEGEVVDDLDQAIDNALAAKTSFVSRAVTAVEVQLTSEVNPYLDTCLDSFDRKWRARRDVEPK